MKYILLMFSIVLFASCSTQEEKQQTKEQMKVKKSKTIAIGSVKELDQLFTDLNYTTESWIQGNREVPRIVFTKVIKSWKKTSDSITVKEKKNIFFRLIGPLVLISNEQIAKERKQLLKEDINSKFVLKLAKKYKVLKKDENTLTKEQLMELKKRVDIIPPSLALAQGATESGWATSRFASDGNALFGQWDYSGKGMKPARQRKELGNYGLAKFDTPLESVQAYMLNLNTGSAYKKLRNLRYKLRKKGKKVTGWELANTLDKYSERRQAYIDDLHSMMRINKLKGTDDAYLTDGPEIHLIKSK